MPLNSRTKGKAAERELAGVLRLHGWDAKRGISQTRGAEQADVVGLPGFWVEVKRQETTSPDKWYAQAQRDAPEGEIPVVVYRRSHQPWKVIIDLEHFLSLLPQRTS